MCLSVFQSISRSADQLARRCSNRTSFCQPLRASFSQHPCHPRMNERRNKTTSQSMTRFTQAISNPQCPPLPTTPPPCPPSPPPPSPSEPVANVTISVKCRMGGEEIRPAGRRKAATVYSHPSQRKPPDDTGPRLGPGPRRHRHCHAAELPIPIPPVPGAAGSSAVGGNLSEIMPRLPMLRCLCVQVLKKLKRRVLVLMNSLPKGLRQGGVCYVARSSFGMFLKWWFKGEKTLGKTTTASVCRNIVTVLHVLW